MRIPGISDGTADAIAALRAGESVSAETLAQHDEHIVLTDGKIDALKTAEQLASVRRRQLGQDEFSWASMALGAGVGFASSIPVLAQLAPNEMVAAAAALTVGGGAIGKLATTAAHLPERLREREDRQALALYARARGAEGFFAPPGVDVDLSVFDPKK